MKLGFLAPLTVENVIAARRLGYDALEASVGWIAAGALPRLEQALPEVQAALAQERIEVTALAVYGDALSTPRDEAIAYYVRAMQVAQALKCRVIAGMTGRDNALTIDENLLLFVERFGPIAAAAAERGLRVALEPWPGRVTGHGPYNWANLAISPELYDRLFDAVDSPALGIEYDASHYVWQGIDHLQVLTEYGARIYHMHAKDIVIDISTLRRAGVHGDGWWRFALPGLGQIDWPALLAAAKSAGYRGDIAVEHEDRAYAGDRWNEGLLVSLKVLRPLIEGLWPA